MNSLPQGYTYRPLPKGLYIGFSDIEGNGLFTKSSLSADTALGVSHIIVKDLLVRTPLGGFINHSLRNNCNVIKIDEDTYHLVTIHDISSNEELLLNYNENDCGMDKICNSVIT